MKKVLPIIAWVLVVSALIGVLVVNTRRVENKTVLKSGKPIIKVGVVTPMSAGFESLKELAVVMERRAAELSADPKSKFEYKLIFEDSQFQPRLSHQAVMKLLWGDKVDFLITVSSMACKVAAPQVERYGVPCLSLADASQADGKWNFTYFLSTTDSGDLAIKTAKELGFKSFVIMGPNQEADVQYGDAMLRAASKYGVECKAKYLWNNDGSQLHDYRIYLLKTRELNPDLYIIFSLPPDIDIVLKQMHDLGMKVQIASTEQLVFVQNKEYIEGAWVAGVPPIQPAMMEKIQKLGVTPTIIYTPYAYDWITVMVRACELAGEKNGGHKPSREQIREALSSLKTVDTLMGRVDQDEKGAFKPQPVLVYYEHATARQVSIDELKKLKGVK